MFGGYADQPPAPGTPSSTGALGQYSNSLGVPVGQPSTMAGSGFDYFPYVYMGPHTTPTQIRAVDPTDPSRGKIGNTSKDANRTVLQMQEKFADSGNDNIHHMALLLALAGYAGDLTAEQAIEFSKSAALNDVLDLHLKYLKDVGNLYGMGKKITPDQYLKQLLDYRLADSWDGKLKSLTPESVSKLSIGGAEASLAGTHTQTTRSVDLLSEQDAQGLVRTMLQNELGRDPTQAEYEDFVSVLHAAQRRNPNVSKTTYTTDAEGRTTNQSTTSTGGLDSAGMEQVMYNKLRKSPSWGEWQAVGTYAPALFAALDAPVSGV